jgi:serine/threonine-protein kinase
MTDAIHCERCGAEIAAGEQHACALAGDRATKNDRGALRPVAAPRAGGDGQAAHAMKPAPELEPVELVDDGFDPLIGTLLGEHYRIIERLGRGGMGTVYLVTHVHLKKKFAAKILNPDTARRPDSIARFQQEAVAASRLDHENIVDIANFGQSEDGTVYLIMEFLRGEALNQILARGRPELDDVLRIVVPICRGLAAAHSAGIVHRDLKPENVFVARRGGRHVVKLLDFGISKLTQQHLGDQGRLTQTGDVLGSPVYMSPEASRGDANVDSRADIYAVGVMLYEMVTGQVPFSAENYLQVLYKHISEEPEPPRKLVPELPAALEAVILRCLEKNPADRYQRIEDVEAALTATVSGVELDAPVAAVAPGPMTSIDAPLPGSSPVLGPSSGSVPVAASTSGARPAPAVAAEPSPQPVAPAKRSRASLLGLLAGFIGTLGVLGFAGYALFRGGDKPERLQPIAARGLPEPTPPAPPTVVEPKPAVAPPEPRSAELRVSTDPAGAQVTLDGEELGVTPLVWTLPVEPGKRTLRVERDGFRPEVRTLSLESSVALTIDLKALPRDKPKPAQQLDIKEGR